MLNYSVYSKQVNCIAMFVMFALMGNYPKIKSSSVKFNKLVMRS